MVTSLFILFGAVKRFAVCLPGKMYIHLSDSIVIMKNSFLGVLCLNFVFEFHKTISALFAIRLI